MYVAPAAANPQPGGVPAPSRPGRANGVCRHLELSPGRVNEIQVELDHPGRLVRGDTIIEDQQAILQQLETMLEREEPLRPFEREVALLPTELPQGLSGSAVDMPDRVQPSHGKEVGIRRVLVEDEVGVGPIAAAGLYLIEGEIQVIPDGPDAVLGAIRLDLGAQNGHRR